ncbi:cytochrome C554 [Vibrio parahaemolyticus]|nr:cytochrome C554 [Vibrio parahaemolyticus]HAS6797251.1 c-type cytochrome [Vibrio parahaemolyticus]
MSFPLGEALFYGQLSLNRESIMLRTLLLTSLIFTSTVYANPFGDAEKGKVKAPSCVYCHGTNGLSSNDAYPNLAGQSPKYLYDSMKAYQDVLRTGPLAEMMKAQLRMLNDEDLRDVAAFFAEQ